MLPRTLGPGANVRARHDNLQASINSLLTCTMPAGRTHQGFVSQTTLNGSTPYVSQRTLCNNIASAIDEEVALDTWDRTRPIISTVRILYVVRGPRQFISLDRGRNKPLNRPLLLRYNDPMLTREGYSYYRKSGLGTLR